MDNIAAPRPTASLLDRLVAGEAAALARVISILDAGGLPGAALHRRVFPLAGQALVVGFTGPPGAGKSTLIDAYVTALRTGGRTVAVAAVDPSSPITGGALLGDRIRMGRHTEDAGVFIRSVASRGHLGGLSETIHRTIDAMDVSGREVVILETVGAGQSEVEVAELADIRIVVNAPGLGDDVQAIKAGILEIADILVVNKADLMLADRTVRQLRAMLQLRATGGDVAVIETVATDGRGVAALAAAIDGLAEARRADRTGRRRDRIRRLLAQAAARQVRDRLLAMQGGELDDLIDAAARGDLDIEAAAALAIALSPPPEGEVAGAKRLREGVTPAGCPHPGSRLRRDSALPSREGKDRSNGSGSPLAPTAAWST